MNNDHTFYDFINNIQNQTQKEKLSSIIQFIDEKYPHFERKIAWGQPMYTDYGTFIIGFSVSSKHISVSPEFKGMEKFREELIKANYNPSTMMFRILNTQEINFDLLKRVIDFNVLDKKNIQTFWRKKED